MVANTSVQQTVTMSQVFGGGIPVQADLDGQIMNDSKPLNAFIYTDATTHTSVPGRH